MLTAEEKLSTIIKDILKNNHQEKNIDLFEQDKNTDIIQNLHFDSIDIMELLVKIEEEFGINLMEQDHVIEIICNYKSILEILKNERKE